MSNCVDEKSDKFGIFYCLKRILFYWSGEYKRSIKSGEDYEKLEKTLAILITDCLIIFLQKNIATNGLL